jgi:hypothetical protein
MEVAGASKVDRCYEPEMVRALALAGFHRRGASKVEGDIDHDFVINCFVT